MHYYIIIEQGTKPSRRRKMNRFKEEIKAGGYPWYVSDWADEEGVIISDGFAGYDRLHDLDNERVQVAGGGIFVPFDLVPDGVTVEDVRATLDDSYAGMVSSGVRIVNRMLTNPENEQRSIDEFASVEYADDDYYRREVLTNTSQYYDWRSEVSDIVKSWEGSTISEEEAREEWLALCAKFEKYRHSEEDGRDKFDQLWNGVEEYRYYHDD